MPIIRRFRKKPVIVEAIQWDGEHSTFYHIRRWSNNNVNYDDVNNKLYIRTLEGTMTANVGDWIIKGVRGEIYPCKADVFNLTYEEIE